MKTMKVWLPALAIMLIFAFAACSNSTNPMNDLPSQNVVTESPGTPIGDNDDFDDFIKKVKEEGGSHTAIITGTIEIAPSRWPNFTFGSKEGITVTLKGSGTLVLKSGKGNMFLLGKGQTLIIDSEDLTLKGRKDVPVRTYSSIVGIGLGAKLVLNAGTITENASVCGGGVYVYTGGVFEMNGGVISNNKATEYGGGVKIEAGGKFVMNDGNISGNIVADGDGGGVFTLGNFTMLGGAISSNKAITYDGGGVAVHRITGFFQMVGGIVYGNEVSADLANTAQREGAALYIESKGQAEYGIFNGSVWAKIGIFFAPPKKGVNGMGIENTIKAVKGVLHH